MRHEFSALKAAWHLDRIAQLRAGEDIVPTHVQIILSDLCNQDCHFCAYRMDGGFSTAEFADGDGNRNPNRRLPTAKAAEIIEDCARLGVGAIEFTGGGEPTVHPDCMDLIALAQDRGIKTGLVTNGVRLKPHPALERLSWLRLSLDAGTEKTYREIRRSDAWPQAMRALALAGTLKGPLVGVGFVVTRENYHELPAATMLARMSGAAYIRVSAMFSMGGADYYAGLEADINESRRRANMQADADFQVIDFFDDRIADLRNQAPDYSFCGYQQFVLYIGGNQKVYTCCTNAYTKHGEIGDLSQQSFADWMVASRRRDFNARGCHHCQFNDKNRVISYMVNTPPHVEFV